MAEILRSERLVDLVKSFPTSIYMYLLAKIGVDTAENEPSKFGGKFNSLFICLLNQHALGPAVFDPVLVLLVQIFHVIECLIEVDQA